MKQYFNVSFQYSEDVYCANIAHAETAADVEAHYSNKYAWVSVSPAADYEVDEARRRGKPIIEIESQPVEKTEENTARTAEQVTAEIIEFFSNNEDVFNDCIEELDSYNGYLGDNRYFAMDELDELYTGIEPSEILRRAFYGHDEETYTTDSSGNRTYDAFNPNREYFSFNGYGNLISADYKDYSGLLDNYAVEAMSENRIYIDTIDTNEELAKLFDELERVNA